MENLLTYIACAKGISKEGKITAQTPSSRDVLAEGSTFWAPPITLVPKALVYSEKQIELPMQGIPKHSIHPSLL